jgi:hypothetical protein
MKQADSIPWKRVSVEGAAIVVSILLAFSIQAWWDDRKEFEDERAVLEALLEEFKAKKETLRIRLSFNEAILKSATTLVRASVEPGHSISSAEIDRHLATFWWYNVSTQWDTPVLSALISGGHLTSITSPDIGIGLARWSAEFGVIKQRVGRDEEYFKNVLMPFLQKNASLPQVYPLVQTMPGQGTDAVSMPGWQVAEPADNTHLLTNKLFVNILTEKVDRHLSILDLSFAGLDSKLDQTINLLEAELSE